MRGKLIIIEGGDGAGKRTQTEMMVKRLREAGRIVETVSFPRYGQDSAKMTESYLRGEFGQKEAVSPFVSSVFYAHDRSLAKPQIEAWLDEGKIILSDRYVPSNMAHQGALIADPATRADFFRWLDDLEYVRLGIPRPDLTIVLTATAAHRDSNVEKKGDRGYIPGRKKDILEDDRPYQERVEAIYREIAALPNCRQVHCLKDGCLLSIDECHDLIWQVIKDVL